ncbi:unnamed protein product [Owenia fusiformis]|uniref:Tetraspanin n=1 Tax=Owenia fusiformis TaxID=6347 RepID=A0A8J1TZP0_OWEFU|nr:unnamed protein product [Owenia fusiformis]
MGKGSGKGEGKGEGGVGCCGGIIKLLLFIFNVVFWLIGAAILGVGIWLKVDKNLVENINKLLPGPYLDIIAIVMIVLGALIFLIGFSGCCGACQESICLLAIYITLMVIIIIAEIAVGVFAYVHRNTLEKELGGALKGQVTNDYEFDNGIGYAWNFLQTEFKCCGSAGPKDFENSKWRQSSGNATQGINVPVTCCVPVSKAGNPQTTVAKNPTLCEAAAATAFAGGAPNKDYLYTDGCYDKLLEFIKKYGVYIIAGLGAVAAIQLFGIAFTSFLIHRIKKSKQEENDALEMQGRSNPGMKV